MNVTEKEKGLGSNLGSDLLSNVRDKQQKVKQLKEGFLWG